MPSVQQQEWAPAPYGMPPFAAAVMQRTLPFFPSSSSSLALALGDPSKLSSTSNVAQSQPQSQYQPQQSAQFFDTFLEETTREAQQTTPTLPPPLPRTPSSSSEFKTPVKTKPPVQGSPMSSPDTLALRTGGITTPLKRKPDELASPTLKRLHSTETCGISRDRSDSTLSVLSSSTAKTTSSRGKPSKRLSVFVELPSMHRGLSTPTTAGRSKSKSVPSTRVEEDLGGFSPPPESEWEDDHKETRTGSKSTGKRTGDRDERGGIFRLRMFLHLANICSLV